MSYLWSVPEEARKPARTPLLQALKDPIASVRNGAAYGLGSFPEDARVVVPALVEALKDKEARVRCAAALSLGYMGPAARQSVPLLIELLKAPFQVEEAALGYQDLGRRNAAIALGCITRNTDVAVKPLIEAFKDQGLEVAEHAVMALGEIGPAAKEAIEPLRQVLKNDNRARMRIHSAASLARIDPPTYTKSSVAFLIKALNDKQQYVRHNAVDALQDIGPAAKEAIPALTRLLKDDDGVLARRAARAIRVIDPQAARKIGLP